MDTAGPERLEQPTQPEQPNQPNEQEQEHSRELFARARRVTPGGVNSPVRAFASVGGNPRFIASAAGAFLKDADGNEYIDYIGSWGPMILGHAHERVEQAIAGALRSGTSFGAPSWREVELAELITTATGLEQLRFVNSGTEATMSAIRLARGATGRKKVLKFRGNYHGHADGLLVEAGSGLLTHAGSEGLDSESKEELGKAAPGSAGVPPEYAALTLVSEYNDPDALREIVREQGGELAAIIFEPVVGNAGVLVPQSEFLAALQEARKGGTLLIADEVMTGFRLALGGACQRLGIEADLRCYGKIIGGGLPVGAYGGSAALMSQVSPLGKVYQAGTLSGNPLAMAAGIATLSELQENPSIYAALDSYGEALAGGLREAAQQSGVAVQVNQIGSMLTVFFTQEAEVNRYAQAAQSDTAAFATWFQSLLRQGIYWAPSAFESIFFSAAHGQSELSRTLEAARVAFAEVAGQAQSEQGKGEA